MACSTISATWGVLSLIIGRASAHDAQNADWAHLVADLRPKPPIFIGQNCQISGECSFRFRAWCLMEESFHCLPQALGRELSFILWCNLVALSANCGWPLDWHSAPGAATRTASRAQMEWSPRAGAHPRSCRSFSATRTLGLPIDMPKIFKPCGRQTSGPSSWTSSGALLAWFHTLVFPWCNLIPASLANTPR